MIIKAIAIDDEPKALDVIKMHAAKVPFLHLDATFTNAFEAIPYISKNALDLIFLDIKMPDISGIEFLNCLKNPPMIIFTTAYSEYAVQGFELNAIDYLLKPFSLARFTKACNRALETNNARIGVSEKYIFIKTGYQEERIFLDEILYVEADGNYISLFLKTRKVLSRQSLNDIAGLLPAHNFIRIHRSFLVALNKIEKLSRQEVTIAGRALPFGVSYEEKLGEIKEKLNAETRI